MKRFFSLLLCIMFMMSFHCLATAQETDNKLAFTMASDAPRTVDLLLYYALKQLGYTPSISIIGNTTTLRMADAGERDGVAFQAKYIGDQFKNIVMVPHYTLKIDLNAYTNTASDIHIETWDDLSNLRVGMIYEKPYVETRLPKSAKITMAGSSNQLFGMLSRGEVDVVIFLKIGDQHFWTPSNIKLDKTIEVIETFTYLNKKYADLAPKLAAVLETMYKDGTADKILKRQIKGEPNEKKLVLRICSYNSDSLWDAKIGNALEQNASINVINVDLNTERVANDAESWKNTTNLLRSDLMGKTPDLIVVSDNDALAFIKECYFSLFDTVPVVFCGINALKPDMINGFETYFTGVAEEVSAKETVEKMVTLFPDTKQIFVINDYALSGRAWRSEIEDQLASFQDKVAITYNANVPFNELLSSIKNLPSDSLILCGEYLVDSEGKGFSEADSQTLFYTNSKVPIFGLKETSFSFGQLGGKYLDSATQGKLASQLMEETFRTGAIPPIMRGTEPLNQWMFDADVMKKYKIDKSKIQTLVHAQYINEVTPLYESNFTLFLSGVLFIAFLLIAGGILAALSISTSRRNKSLIHIQKSLFTAEQLLEKDLAVREVKEYIERLIDTSPIGYALIAEGRVIEANKYLAKFLGIHAGDSVQGLGLEQVLSVNENQHLLSQSIQLPTPDGENRRFFISTASVGFNQKEATILWCVDAEEYERQNDTLNQLQHELEKILETLPLPLVIKNAHSLEIRYCNQSFLDLFEVGSREKAQTLSMRAFYPENQPSGQPSIKKIRQNIDIALSTGKSTKWEWQYVLPSDQQLDALVSVTPCIYQNETCTIEIIVDIGDDKKRDKMLQNMADKEREASKLKSRFLVNMSHEIRTPMNAIIGLSELYLLNNKDTAGYDSLKKINQSAKSLLAIINDILDFSKLEAAKFELRETSFVLEELLTDVMLRASQHVEEKPLEMHATLSCKIPDKILSDKNRLSQLLLNVVENAAKFTDAVSISITVSVQKIVDPHTFMLTFCIEDTGIGMSEEEIDKIFRPFEQFNNDTHSRHSGTGLGTTIVKQLVDLMKGEIAVSSQLGVGTKFTIQLPVKSESPLLDDINEVKRIVCNKVTTQDTRYRQFPHAKILLCEDNYINQEVALGVLELFGASATIANNGAEALAILDTAHFDLILMDINMPVMNGYEATKRIRESDKGYEKIPIIAMTGNARNDEISKCVDVGMNDYVEKPINIDALYSEIAKYL